MLNNDFDILWKVRNNTAPIYNMSLLFQSPFSLCLNSRTYLKPLKNIWGNFRNHFLMIIQKATIKTFYKIALDYESRKGCESDRLRKTLKLIFTD